MSEKRSPHILILGSIAWGIGYVPVPKATAGTYMRHASWLGAPTLRYIIHEALVKKSTKANHKTIRARLHGVEPPTKGRKKQDLIDACEEHVYVLDHFPSKSTSIQTVRKVLRIRDIFIVNDQPMGRSGETISGGELFEELISRACGGSTPASPRVVTILDMDRRFRRAFTSVVKKRTRNQRHRLEGWLTDKQDALVVAIGHGLNSSDTLASVHDGSRFTDFVGAIKAVNSRVKDRTITLIRARDLRDAGCNIVEYGSLELTLRRVMEHVNQPPLSTIFQFCNHIVVLFEETGALHLYRDESGKYSGSLHSCPNMDRQAQMDPRRYGRSPGKTQIFVAALVKHLDSTISTGEICDIPAALRLGVVAYNEYFNEGFRGMENPIMALKRSLEFYRRDVLCRKAGTDRDFFLASLSCQRAATNSITNWNRVTALVESRVESLQRQREDIVRTLLHTIVLHGEDAAFRTLGDKVGDRQVGPAGPLAGSGGVGVNPPRDTSGLLEATIACPYAEFGKIRTIDPSEIQSYLELVHLIRKYVQDAKWDAPLSIAVFGPPGSGKSFAVKELLKRAHPDAQSQRPLEFNLAQFSSVDQLTDAFHQIQDHALTFDISVTIFDEFDANFEGGALGWLKYFLAPMQDGLFRGKSGNYHVGRSILVFSGGTAYTFAEFRKGPISDRTNRTKAKQLIKNVKLKDFVSRLKGYLNVLGIDEPRDGREGKTDKLLRIVRRAMILRSLLQQHATPIFAKDRTEKRDTARIDPSVIDAFLDVRSYTHGVRSMQAIIQMSRWIGGKFVLSSLPSPDQLMIHAPDLCKRIEGRRQPTRSN